MALERREACCAYLPTQPALIQRYTLFHWWPGDARGTILRLLGMWRRGARAKAVRFYGYTHPLALLKKLIRPPSRCVCTTHTAVGIGFLRTFLGGGGRCSTCWGCTSNQCL